MPESPAIDALLLDAHGVCRALSIGVSHFHGLRKAGAFPLMPIRLGRSVRWKLSELLLWTEAGCPNQRRWDFIIQSQTAGKRATG